MTEGRDEERTEDRKESVSHGGSKGGRGEEEPRALMWASTGGATSVEALRFEKENGARKFQIYSHASDGNSYRKGEERWLQP